MSKLHFTPPRRGDRCCCRLILLLPLLLTPSRQSALSASCFRTTHDKRRRHFFLPFFCGQERRRVGWLASPQLPIGRLIGYERSHPENRDFVIRRSLKTAENSSNLLTSSFVLLEFKTLILPRWVLNLQPWVSTLFYSVGSELTFLVCN